MSYLHSKFSSLRFCTPPWANSLTASGIQRRQNDRSPCPDSSPTTVGSFQNFTVFCGQDYGGSDLAQVPASSLTDCVDSCAKHVGLDQCVAVSYEASSLHGRNNCYFKNIASTLVTQDFVMDSALAIWPTTEADCTNIESGFTSNGAGFDIYCGKDYPQDDKGSEHTNSMKECMERCAVDSSCAGISYDAAMANGFFNCYYKSKIAVSGLKVETVVIDTAFVVRDEIPSESASTISASPTSLVQATSSGFTTSIASSSPTTSSMEPTSSPTSHSSGSKAWIAGAVVGPIAAIALVAFLCFFFYRRGRRELQKIKSGGSGPPQEVHEADDQNAVPVEAASEKVGCGSDRSGHRDNVSAGANGAQEVSGRPIYEVP